MKLGVNYKVEIDYRIPMTFGTWVEASRFIEYLVTGADNKVTIEIEAIPKNEPKKDDVLKALDEMDDDEQEEEDE